MTQEAVTGSLTGDGLSRMIGQDLAGLVDPGTLRSCLDEALNGDMGVTPSELAVARALLHRVAGAALLNGNKSAVGDAAVLYRMVAAANSLLMGRVRPVAEVSLTQEAEAKRYRWLRPRLRVRPMHSMSGALRNGLDVRVGQSFFDVQTRGARGYVDPAVFDAECAELDAEIDDAFAAQQSGGGLRGRVRK